MKQHYRYAAFLAILSVLIMGGSCQKPYHEETEHYVFVAANINLPYWQEAQAGFMDAARTMGVKADFAGPASYSPEEELAAFR